MAAPTSKRELYTFFCEFLEQRYVAQVTATSPAQAKNRWAVELQTKHMKGMGPAIKQRLVREVKDEDYLVAFPAYGFTNAFAFTISPFGKFGIVDLVQTDIVETKGDCAQSSLYTIFIDFQGGTYSWQIEAEDFASLKTKLVAQMALETVDEIRRLMDQDFAKALLANAVLPMENLINVWSIKVLVNGHLANVYIIKTVR